GAFTIPTMKKIGYKPVQAAAIEAAASTGGQIMPPIMGAAAFLMVGFTGIPYIKIIAAAAIPAILYFGVLALYAQLHGLKLNIPPSTEKVNYKELLLTAPLFVLPLILLIIFLAMGQTAMFAVSRGLLLLIVLGLIRKETRPSLSEAAKGCASGALMGAQIGVSTACIGIIIKVFTMTGLGIVLPNAIVGWSGGILGFTLIIGAIVAIILGMGMPTSAVYVLAAIVIAPALVRGGLDILQAHLFVLYFACLNFVTPPVAVVALIASKLAGAPFLKTAVESTKAALAGFVVPFLFILSPILILQHQDLLAALTGILSAVLILTALQIAICNYYFTGLSRLERVAFVVAAAALFIYLATEIYTLLAIGIIVFTLLTIRQVKKRLLGKTLIRDS
ncbi:TRAP transporter fused permease subunit, partial [Chloroflexota bacterium]